MFIVHDFDWSAYISILHDRNWNMCIKRPARLTYHQWEGDETMAMTSSHLAVCQNLVPLVNIKIAGKWMFIPLKMVLIGIDPYPSQGQPVAAPGAFVGPVPALKLELPHSQSKEAMWLPTLCCWKVRFETEISMANGDNNACRIYTENSK